jgi:hypothetical protein
MAGFVIAGVALLMSLALAVRLRSSTRLLEEVQSLFDLYEVVGTIPDNDLYDLALARAVALTHSREGFVHVVSDVEPSRPNPSSECLSAPVIDAGRAKLILYVGNKRLPYTNADVRRLNLVAAKLSRLIAKQRIEQELRESLHHIQTLHGLIPICAWCKKVRDDDGYWSSVEKYFTERTDATFTHGICPDCKRKTVASVSQ